MTKDELLKEWAKLLVYKREPGIKIPKNKNKKVAKHQIIRESDFNKLPVSFLKEYKASFKPLTKDWFDRRCSFYYLKNKKYLGDQYALAEYPNHMLKRLTNIPLFDESYKDWFIKYNDNNEMVIRAGLRRPESRLGLATFMEILKDE